MECDPTGRGAHEPGAKLDAGKARCSLVLGGFSRALEQVALVGTFGAAKYTDNGWRSVPNGQERYTDALWRHLLEEGKGLKADPDSSLLHAAHAAWNALARLELMLTMAEGDASDPAGEPEGLPAWSFGLPLRAVTTAPPEPPSDPVKGLTNGDERDTLIKSSGNALS